MTKILCISRLVGVCKKPTLDVHDAALEAIAGPAVHLEFVYSGDQDRIRELLCSDWDAIWARGVPAELRDEIERHRAVKITAVNRKIEQPRQGRHTEEFDHFAVVEPREPTPLAAGSLVSPELV